MKNNYLNNEFYFEWWQIINPVSKTWKKIMNPFVPFFTPCKHQTAVCFLRVSGGIGKGQWYEMG